MKKIRLKGFSLIEILVILFIFGIIGIMTTQAILTSLKGARKTDADSKVRQNLDYVMALMERHLRNATAATCMGSNRVDFVDQRSQNPYFIYYSSNCPGGDATDACIASASSQAASAYRISSDDVTITQASFVCSQPIGKVSPSVQITLTGESRNSQGVDRSPVTTSITIFLRTSY